MVTNLPTYVCCETSLKDPEYLKPNAEYFKPKPSDQGQIHQSFDHQKPALYCGQKPHAGEQRVLDHKCILVTCRNC